MVLAELNVFGYNCQLGITFYHRHLVLESLAMGKMYWLKMMAKW
jgi:hypothetical protein